MTIHATRALGLLLLFFTPLFAGAQAPAAPPPETGEAGQEEVSREAVSLEAVSLEDSLEALRERFRQPAVAVAVTSSKELLAQAAVGLRRVDSQVPVEVDDRFHAGSLTKAMTATMMARLVEEGKIDWNTRAGELFSDLFRSGRGIPGEKVQLAYVNVTVEELLTHRSGLPPDDSAGDDWLKTLRDMQGPLPVQRMDVVTLAFRRVPEGRRRKRMEYSNLGYTIAGAMAETATQKSWEELMRSYLFEPLGMKSAGFGAPGTPRKIEEPFGHFIRDGKQVPRSLGRWADNPPVLGPAGTVHASVADLAKFAALHLAGARGESDFLKPETFERLHTPPRFSNYAYGWAVAERPWARGKTLSHSGSNTMWFAVIWIAPEIDRAFVAAVNSADRRSAPACNAAINELVKRFAPPPEPPQPPRPPAQEETAPSGAATGS